MYAAIEIARYIINKCTVEGHPISNLQLQKILYYIQKDFLQVGKMAFYDEIEAWQFGPVVREVYNQYCGFGASKIRLLYEVNIDDDYKCMIDPIVCEKRVLDPWVMVDDTHTKDKAWYIIYNNGKGNHRVIPNELIKEKG